MIKEYIVKNMEDETVIFYDFPSDFTDLEFKKLATNYFDNKDVKQFKCFKNPKLDEQSIYVEQDGNYIVAHGNIDYIVHYDDVKILYSPNINSVHLFKHKCPICEELLYTYTNDDVCKCWNCDTLCDLTNVDSIKLIKE